MIDEVSLTEINKFQWNIYFDQIPFHNNIMAALTRLNKELTDLKNNPPEGVICEPEAGNNRNWNVSICNPANTPYSAGIFNLQLKFPENYPFKAPEALFVTKIYHPNVKSDTGEICQDIYGAAKWVPTLNARYVVEAILSMLHNPNLESPLEPEIAKQYASDYNGFVNTAREWAQKFAN